MPSLEILPQLIINGLIAGSIYALAASGLSLTYYVVKFLNFAHGAIITISAYMFFLFFSLRLNFILSALLSVAVSVLAILLMNFLVFKNLRRRKATNVVTMISSLALLIFSSALVLAIFGSSTKRINLYNKSFDFGVFSITLIQSIIVFSSVFLFLFLWVMLKKTRLGKAMRSLSDNREAAQVVGINPEKIYTYTFAIAGFLGAVAGILIGIEQNLYPKIGVPIIIKGFISSVIGGVNSVYGSVIGGLFIGLAENIGIWFLPSGYRDVISFSILLLFLIFKPNGILGGKRRDD